ncbi:MAG: oxidoreductase [Saprospiraceae bacterium]|nr:oxidoreductase [Saprospiraceae bacterium]
MAWKWYDSTVVKIADESPTARRIWLELNASEEFTFEAGQFVTMDLPIDEKRLKRWRSYSIANAPNGEGLLEFCVLKLEGGAASRYFFEELELGATIRFKGPDGAFTLPASLDKDLVLICTGTGVAPFRSMIGDIYRRNLPHRRIHLIFGTRYANGILYRDEFEQLRRDHPEFSYDVALSREADLYPTQFPFPVYKGYIHQIYLQHYAESRPDVSFYLCGWSNMIDDAVANLIVKLGYDKSQVHYELYG